METMEIRDEVQYETALNRIWTIFDAEDGSREKKELDLLSNLVTEYEIKLHPLKEESVLEVVQ
ncbi:MAG: transcriptional regulator [Chitinophagales bacterium]|nr:transcriptional regulator [Chitinophagales bacterium]